MLALIFGGALLAVIDWKVQRLPRRIVFSTLAAVAGGLVFAAMVNGTGSRSPPQRSAPRCSASAFFLIWV